MSSLLKPSWIEQVLIERGQYLRVVERGEVLPNPSEMRASSPCNNTGSTLDLKMLTELLFLLDHYGIRGFTAFFWGYVDTVCHPATPVQAQNQKYRLSQKRLPWFRHYKRLQRLSCLPHLKLNRSPNAATMSSPTPLAGAIAILMGVFEKYASKDANSKTLSRAEVKTLIEKELPMFVEVDDCFYLLRFPCCRVCNWSFLSQFDL